MTRRAAVTALLTCALLAVAVDVATDRFGVLVGLVLVIGTLCVIGGVLGIFVAVTGDGPEVARLIPGRRRS